MSPSIAWISGAALPADRPSTLGELFSRCVARLGSTTVLVDGELGLSWQDLDLWSGRIAAALADRVAPGERIAILAPNGAAHLLVELAAWRLAAVAAPIFTGFGQQRLRALVAELDPRVVVVADPAHAACAPPGAEIISTARVLEWARSSVRGIDRPASARTPCLIQFTSGSTGAPRGVVLCHDNLASQQAAFAQLWPEIGAGDRLASYLPWHHSFGALAERLWALCRGATITVVPGGGRDRQRFVDTVRAVRPTVFMSVPKMHAVALGEHALDARALRWAFTAGAPLPEELFAAYQRLGAPVYEGWGLTETSPSATITPPGSRHHPGVVGVPIPGVEVGVEADTGRILVRGPNVMLGYHRREAPTLVDGGLDSGDLGRWSDHGLVLTGRADQVLKLGNGEKVAAAEIEAALLAHPSVHHAVVAADGELIALLDAHAGHRMSALADAVRAANAAEPVPYRRIARAYALSRPCTIENGQLTASMKVARGAVLSMWSRWTSEGGAEVVAIAL
ncbi:MAG: AMP-binding protein [Planctomycetes bacterium]|nr:AMP-binding protein [Planctomycetota bacterium]